MTDIFETIPRIETQRLVLREIRPDEADALYGVWGDEDVMQFISIGTIKSVEQARAQIEAWSRQFRTGEQMWWGMALKTDDTLIGSCCYIGWNRAHSFAEIGYILGKPYWRQGYTEETVGALIRFGFEVMGLNRIEARVMVGNEKSMRLLAKLGFHHEGVLRERKFAQGKFHDFNWLSLLKSDVRRE